MGKACCPDTTQDTPQGPVSACHGAQHTWLQPRALRTAASDLERSMAEHRGEEAGAVNVSVGRGAEPYREESPRAGAGPGAKAGLGPHTWWTASETTSCCDFLDWELSCKFKEESCLQRGTGQGWPWVIFSSLTALVPAPKFNRAPLRRPLHTALVATRAGPRDPLR